MLRFLTFVLSICHTMAAKKGKSELSVNSNTSILQDILKEVRGLKRTIDTLIDNDKTQIANGRQVQQKLTRLMLMHEESERYDKSTCKDTLDAVQRIVMKFNEGMAPLAALRMQLSEQRDRWIIRRPAA